MRRTRTAEVETIEGLLREARGRDRAALEALCARLRGPLLLRIRRRIRGDGARWVDPEDIAQRLLVELIEKLPSLPPETGEEGLWAWLGRRIEWRLASVARDHAALRGPTALAGSLARHGAPCPTDGTVTREDTRRLVRELVALLPREYAEVVGLCVLEGLSFVDAGARLGLGADTVRKRYGRARAALARRLGEWCDD